MGSPEVPGNRWRPIVETLVLIAAILVVFWLSFLLCGCTTCEPEVRTVYETVEVEVPGPSPQVPLIAEPAPPEIHATDTPEQAIQCLIEALKLYVDAFRDQRAVVVTANGNDTSTP